MPENNLNINSEDNELVAAFNSGNVTAFNLIVRKYHKRVYWLIRKMVLDHDDADDITQEVFIKMHSSLREFRGDSKLFTYIYKIAVNLSINQLNRNKRVLSRRSGTDDSELKSDSQPADEEITSAERSKLLEEAIETLPAQQRAVFNMRYYDNLSYEEISHIMNKSVGGMKANYFHALKNIGKYLKASKKFELIEFT